MVRRLASGEEHVIAFAEEAYALGINAGYEFATNILRFTIVDDDAGRSLGL